ncbi:glycosyltransferase [Marinimicrobium koreense]|uniref:glycosyltransferase n=1 Tax=Marinimicrobium koreense TaxID=306545 RepID=UPI003F704FD1
MKKTWSFELLQRVGNKRLFTAHWGTDNLEWMKRIAVSDCVVFSDVSMPGPADSVLKVLAQVPNPDSFVFLCNDYQVYEDRRRAGLNAHFINQNAFINERRLDFQESADKEYDAVYNARLRPVKRHSLAKLVGERLKLALIIGHHTPGLGSIPDSEIPKNVYMNKFQLMPETVSRILSKSRVGLILSESEGACFASSEYLLTGLPVVSTPSRGGRDFWYDDYNSIICEPNEDSVYQAVQTLINEPRDPKVIREGHIKKMYMHRQKFIERVYKPFVDGVVDDREADSIFDELEFRRYMAFQSKFSWKSMESILTFIDEDRSVYDDEPERFQPALEPVVKSVL